MRNFLIFTTILLIGLQGVGSEIKQTDLKTDLSKNLPDLQSVNCKFVQERKFSTSKVKSSGNFKFVKGKGVYFVTTYPVKSVSSYTSSNNKYINDVILAVSKKNFSKIEKDFDLNFSKPKQGQCWNIYMSAKNENIKKYLDSIKIQGDNKHITEIQLNQANPAVQTNIKFLFGD